MNIKLMEKELHISYPTVKSRLKSIINTLGYHQEESSSTERIKILKDLSDNKIDVKDAMKNLENLK